MNKIDKIIKQGLNTGTDKKIDMSLKIMKKIEDFEYKKENIRFKVINYLLSFVTIVLSILSIYSIEFILPDFRLYLNVIKIDYLFLKFILQGFFIIFIIVILSVLSYNMVKSLKTFHIKVRNLLF